MLKNPFTNSGKTRSGVNSQPGQDVEPATIRPKKTGRNIILGVMAVLIAMIMAPIASISSFIPGFNSNAQARHARGHRRRRSGWRRYHSYRRSGRGNVHNFSRSIAWGWVWGGGGWRGRGRGRRRRGRRRRRP